MRLSKTKRDRIAEQILAFLYHSFPNQPFTATVSQEIARDEEFVKKILFELKEKGLVVQIRKNVKGITFTRRIRWTLTKRVYNVYSENLRDSRL
jgi:DNA-binding IscR family transcriptional regulator